HVTKDWALEIVFEMGEPMRRAHNCRPLADYGIGKAYAVWRDAVLDVLLHAVPNGDMRPILSLLRQGGNLMQLYCYRRDVRFGSKADICAATSDVRFTPNSDRESRHPQKVMSALPPKADMCSANTNVRYGPEADITNLFDHIVGTRQQRLRNGEAKRLRGPLVDV